MKYPRPHPSFAVKPAPITSFFQSANRSSFHARGDYQLSRLAINLVVSHEFLPRAFCSRPDAARSVSDTRCSRTSLIEHHPNALSSTQASSIQVSRRTLSLPPQQPSKCRHHRPTSLTPILSNAPPSPPPPHSHSARSSACTPSAKHPSQIPRQSEVSVPPATPAA